MRILVIGGTGFVGLPVLKQLSRLGHTLLVVHRGQTPVDDFPGVEHVLTDRANLQAHRQEFQRFAPEVVVDMIPYTLQDAQVVTALFQGLAQRLVVLSSVDVTRAHGRVIHIETGPIEPVPLTEETSLREKLYPYRAVKPRSQDAPEYWKDDYEKILVERTVMGDKSLPATILRLPMIYGPRDEQHRLFTFLKRMDDRRPVILLGERYAHWRWSRGYVGNVAAAIVLAVTDARAAGRIYNVCEEPTLTIQEWVKAIGRAAGWDGVVLSIPEEHLPEQLTARIDTSQDLLYDISRIRRELGYAEPISLDEALEQTIAWQRANPPTDVDATLFDYALEDATIAKLQGRPQSTS